MFSTHGKIALVTGGASRLGFSFVRQLLKNDLKGVTIADVDAKRGEEARRAIDEEFGPGRAIFVRTDVTARDEVEAAFEKTVEVFENLDLVVNSAGIFDEEKWETCVAVNLCGTVRVSLLAAERYLPAHKSSQEAIIINVASICGLESFGSLPMYTATKHGVVGFSRSLGVEEHHQRTGVRVLTICPGITDTPLVASSHGNLFDSTYALMAEKELFVRQAQKPDVVAEALLRIIGEGSTGSVWVVEAERTYQIKFSSLLEDF